MDSWAALMPPRHRRRLSHWRQTLGRSIHVPPAGPAPCMTSRQGQPQLPSATASESSPASQWSMLKLPSLHRSGMVSKWAWGRLKWCRWSPVGHGVETVALVIGKLVKPWTQLTHAHLSWRMSQKSVLFAACYVCLWRSDQISFTYYFVYHCNNIASILGNSP